MKLNELEIKIKLDSSDHFQKVYETCQKLFGRPTAHLVQLDEYFDTSDKQLKKQDLVIRIRTCGSKRTIALKSPRVELPSGISNRIELEFEAADGDSVREQLTRQGLQPFEAAEKERWAFVHGECEIVLDRLPFIGVFVEIEGPDEATIQGVVEALHLSKCEVVRKNYGELMKVKFAELGLPLTNIQATFAAEQKWSERVL